MPSPTRPSHGPLCPRGCGIFLALGLLAACASPDPQPFQAFSKAATGAGTATHKALKESVAQSRDGLIDSIRDPEAFNSLKLYFRSEPGSYTWGNQPDGSWKDVIPSLSVQPPPEATLPAGLPPVPGPDSAQWINYYYKPQRLSSRIEAFNQVLADYAALLSSLAGRDFVSDEDFKKMATNLNARVSEIGRQAGISAPKETAIFSASATALFEQYLKSRQRSVLHRAIAENTEQIRRFSQLGQQLTLLLSVPVQRAYGQNFDDLHRQFESTKTDTSRRKQVQAAVALNDAMIGRWELFAEMDSLYRRIPSAHEDLAKAADGKGAFAAILEMSQSVQRLQKIYKSLEESNEKAAKAEARKEEHP